MRIYFLHSGNPISAEEAERTETLQMYSVCSRSLSKFNKKAMVNARAQMDSIAAQGVEISYGILDRRNSFFDFIRSGMNFRAHVKRTNCTLVHVTWGTFSSFLAVLFSPVPVVISFCGSDLLGGYQLDGEKSMRSKVSVWLSQLSALGARRIITKSDKLKDALWNVSKKKATVIPNGVNLSFFFPTDKAEARKRLGWDPDAKVILFFNAKGQTVKNRPLADETFAKVATDLPGTKIIIVEEVPHQELLYYYNAADVMLLTSFHEGSNNSTKEALACNLPVVSVDCGDSRARLEHVHPSYVSRNYDSSELAAACLDILKKGQRANGYEIIKELSEENVAVRIKGIYTSALG